MVDASGHALSTDLVGGAPRGLTLALAHARRRWKPVLALLLMAGLTGLALLSGTGWFYLLGGVSTGCLAVVIAWRLSVALRISEQNAAELMTAYTQARRELERREDSYRRLLHDARSTGVGIRTAVEVIGSRPGLSAEEIQRLRWCVLSELNRLQGLLDDHGPETCVDFDLPAILEPIILTHRIQGMAIELATDDAVAHGRPRATATVLDNLLRNVHLHARGAHVQLHITCDESQVTVVVDDDGPGIPAELTDRVLLPGVRGSAADAPGSGLGLHIASTTILEQAGTLQVGTRPGGGTRVTFTLPASAAVPEPDSATRPAG